ncbi:hypothetical protein GCM10022198_10280 [Klugiella xanthotipulae]|uniref:Minor tail protein n=1 Tax=Klugiella xanthotipulae TaxID=244735 RepID=A0A543HYK1_9MICO|nr:hypothetical protein [Klugiella xanthotipulae]TQM63426.1 hypothetical protein FB466_1688 [Klugiella xanthotipulae]
MTTFPGFPTAPGLVALTESRNGLAGLIARSTSGTLRAGVLPRNESSVLVTPGESAVGTDGSVTTAVSVAPFEAVLPHGGGAIAVGNTSAVRVPLDRADAALARIDVIWVQPAPSSYLRHFSLRGAQISRTTGTPSATPVAPEIPDGAFVLAQVSVARAATAITAANITEKYTFTATAGGTVVVRTGTELAAWTPHNGATAYALDTGTSYTRRGGEWQPASFGVTLMQRTTAVLSAPKDVWASISASSAWTALSTAPDVTYANGFVCAKAGLYQVGYSVVHSLTQSAFGVLVGETAVTNFRNVQAGATFPANFPLGTASTYVQVPAGGVVRLFAAGMGAAMTVDPSVPKWWLRRVS